MASGASDSAVQRQAERWILDWVSADIGVALAPRRLVLSNGSYVEIDGVAADEAILVEAFARQGALKGGQRHKLATDILKLITVASERSPRPRLVLGLADPVVAATLAGKSWLAATLSVWNVEIRVAELETSQRELIRDAQVRQVMVNPPSDEGPSGAPPALTIPAPIPDREFRNKE